MSATSGRRRNSFGPWATAVTGTVVLVAITIAVLAVGRANLRSAEEERTADRAALLARFNAAGAATYDSDLLIRRISAIPFSPDDATSNETLLSLVRLSPNGDPLVATLVVDLAGDPIGSLPPGTVVAPEILESALAFNIDGRTGVTGSFELRGELVWARTIPLGGEAPWGALVTVEAVETGWVQRLYSELGALGAGDGGFILIDGNDVAVAAWDPTLLGSSPVPADELTRLDTEVSSWSSERDGTQLTRVGARLGDGSDAGVQIFEQPTSALFGDLRDLQRERDVALVAMAAASLLAVVGFGLIRERSVRLERRRSEVILANTSDVIAVIDEAANVVYANPSLAAVLGHDPADAIGQSIFELVAPEHHERARAALRAAVHEGDALLMGIPLQAADGSARWFDVALSKPGDTDTTGGIVVTCREIGARKELEDSLAFEAEHDPLTGLANRERFDGQLHEVAGRGRPFAVITLDLDSFKELNDAAGHSAGDEALCRVAAALERTVRGDDLVARLGGDEFAILMPEIGLDSLRALAERVAAAVGTTTGVSAGPQGGRLVLGASVGAVWSPGSGENPGELLRRADAAMYSAKSAGGGRAVVTEATGEPRPSAGEPFGAEPSAGRHAPADTADVVPWPGAVTVRAGQPRSASPSLLGRVGPLVLAAVIVTAIGAGLFALNDRTQSHAEQERVGDRAALTQALGELAVSMADISKLVPIVSATPWDLDSPELLDVLLRIYSSAMTDSESAVAALVSADRQVHAVYPTGASIPEEVFGGRWEEALGGLAYSTPLIDDGEGDRLYSVVPVVRDGEVDMALVIGVATVDLGWSGALTSIGAIGDGPGGLSIVDENGAALASWSRELVGLQLIGSSELERIGTDGPAVLRGGVDGVDTVTIATRAPHATADRFAVWQQDATGLFGDLRQGSAVYDGAILTMLVAATIWLILANARREQDLRLSRERLDALLESSRDLLLIVGADGLVRFASSAAQPLLGVAREDLAGRFLGELIGAERAAKIRGGGNGETGPTTTTLSDVQLETSAGETRIFDLTALDLCAQPEVRGVLVTLHDMTDRSRLQDELRDRALRDPLTGLANRAQLNLELQALHTGAPDVPASHAVLFIDLDHFKPVNDRLGHHAGDAVLREVSDRLTASVRSGDVVCRLGGDEFAVLLRGCSRAEATETAVRLLEALDRPITAAGVQVQVAASIGVALSHSDLRHPEQLIREADRAMYEAKHAGRARFVLSSSTPRSQG